MLARKAATAVAVAEFIMTQSNSPAAERVHFSPRRQDLDGRRMLARPLSAGVRANPGSNSGLLPSEQGEFERRQVNARS